MHVLNQAQMLKKSKGYVHGPNFRRCGRNSWAGTVEFFWVWYPLLERLRLSEIVYNVWTILRKRLVKSSSSSPWRQKLIVAIILIRSSTLVRGPKIAKHVSCSPSCLTITFQAVLSRCGTALVDGQERPVDENYKSAFRYACEELGGLGERLVALCDYR